MNHPIISIVIPCYNGEKYLRETLECLIKQTITDWECVMVNDGSLDGSVEIMKEYASKDTRFSYIDKHNEGPSIARNVAINASRGKYILPLDADDLLHPACVEKMAVYLEEHPECSLVTCNVQYFGSRTDRMRLPDYSFETLLHSNCMVCTSMFRKNDFDKTGGYNPNMRNGFEDWDFWLTLLNRDSIVHNIDEVLFFYRIKEKSRNVEAGDYLSTLHRQLYMNHPDLYKPYVEGIVGVLGERAYMKSELNSKSYKLALRIRSMYQPILYLLQKFQKN